MCKKSTTVTREVKKITNLDFVKNNADFERYVFVYSAGYKAIFGDSLTEKPTPSALVGLVKISYKGKSVYRKCIGANIPKEHLQIGYRTKCELGVDYGDTVTIIPTNWFKYLCCNSDSYFKWPFIIALIALFFTIISLFISIATLIL